MNTHQIFYLQAVSLDHGVKLEECGLLFWDSEYKLLYLWKLPNAHPDPRHHFRIRRSQALALIEAAREEELTPVGVFHTHVEEDNPDPSPHDFEQLVALTRIKQYRMWYGVVYHSPTKTLTYYNGHRVLHKVVLTRNSDGSCVAKHRP